MFQDMEEAGGYIFRLLVVGQIYLLKSDVDHEIAWHTTLEQLKKPKQMKTYRHEVGFSVACKKQPPDWYDALIWTLQKSHKKYTNISGLMPSPPTSPSSTCHPEGISTETITGDFLFVWSLFRVPTNLLIISSKGGLAAPEEFEDKSMPQKTEKGKIIQRKLSQKSHNIKRQRSTTKVNEYLLLACTVGVWLFQRHHQECMTVIYPSFLYSKKIISSSLS